MAAFVTGLLITLIFLFVVLGGVEEYNMLPDEEKATTTIFNFGLYAVIAMIIIGLILSFLFGIWFMVTHPKQALRFGIGFGALLVIFFVLYSVSEAEASGKLAELAQNSGVNENNSKMISAGIYTLLILAGLAIVSLVVAELRNLFK